MIPETLITYIETAIIPRYKEFDKAHNLSHVRTVIEESLALGKPELQITAGCIFCHEMLMEPLVVPLLVGGRILFQPNIRGGKVIAVSMKHMPHFISDYGNGLFPKWNRVFSIRKQSVSYNGTNRFIPSKQVVSYKRNNLFRRGVTKCSVL